MTRLKVSTWALVAGVLSLGLMLMVGPDTEATALLVGKPAPDFMLHGSSGNHVHLADYRGKAVLVNFWATWCGPCRVEIPWFVEFDRSYRDRGFAVIGVSLDAEGWSAVRPFVEQKNVSYPVVLGDDRISQQYGGIDSLPTSFVLDRAGKIVAVHNGLVSKATYEADIQKALGGR